MTKKNESLIERVRDRFSACVDYESFARNNYDNDTKFANGDSINNYQWPDNIRFNRVGAVGGAGSAKPCLTINKTKVHNLSIINDAKQNKPGVNIRPIGDGATYEAAQVYMDIVRHIEYRSNAESIYDNATVTQVEGGIGYWRVMTAYESNKSFDQEILLAPIGDPRSVYLDPDIRNADGSDARFGFIYEDMPKDLFKEKFPNADDDTYGPAIPGDYTGDWITKDHVRVCEYFEKSQKKDRLVSFLDPNGERVTATYSDLTDEGKEYFKTVRDSEDTNVRDIITDNIKWYKIAGCKVIEEKDWPGIYIPIVRVIGTEIILDGRLDRFGNTRAMLDPQRLFNYNASNYAEMVALQPRSPFVGPAAAIEGQEEYWKTANTRDHSILPYNHISEDGTPIPPPQRSAPPQIPTAYMAGMDMSEKQMMMASGQYQSQMGENENAKSGVAINARQRQGERATYHFIDNLAIAIRFTGKILIDLIPKIYDTQRVVRIRGLDGKVSDVLIDPNAPDALQKQKQQQEEMDRGIAVSKIIFNPNVGTYDVQADIGPGYATRRQEAWNAFTQIASQNPKIMEIAGDLMFKVADFPMADELSQRFARTIPPNITGDGPSPQMEQALNMASDKIEQLTAEIADMARKLADKEKDLDIKAFNAESGRLRDIANTTPTIDKAQLEPLIKEMLAGMMANPKPLNTNPLDELGLNSMPTNQGAMEQPLQRDDMMLNDDDMNMESEGEAPMDGAQQAPDGNWYVPDESRPGKFLMVEVG